MSRVYLDTNIFVYHFEGHAEFGERSRAIFERARLPQHTLISSIFVLSELLVDPVRLNDEFRAAGLNRFFRSGAVTLIPYPMEATAIYAELRAHYRLKPLDTLHLAAAAYAGGDLFITNDERLTKTTIPGIGRIAGLDVQF